MSNREEAMVDDERRKQKPWLIRRGWSSGQIKSFAALSSSLLPAFGAGVDGNYPDIKKYIIAPYDPRYRWWQMFLIVLVFYSAWASPLELAFPQVSSGSLLVVDLVVDVFFGVDIVVSFSVAYFNSSTYLLVDDRRKIAKRYLTRPWFVMDVASTIPFHIIYRIITGRGNGGSVFGVVNLLRLWRLRRASKLFARLEKDIRFSYFWTRYVKLICVSSSACHAWNPHELGSFGPRCLLLLLPGAGDTVRGALIGLRVLLDGHPLPGEGEDMDRQPDSGFPRAKHMAGLHLRRLLVHHHPHNRRLRRLARLEHRREGVHHLPHALQHRPHRLPHRQHDQPHRPRRHPHLPHEGHHSSSFAVREQAPAAGRPAGADDGTPTAPVQDDGVAAGRGDRGPAQGDQIHHRPAPLPAHRGSHVPLQRSLTGVHSAAGFRDESRVLPSQSGHHHRERDPHGPVHHRLWRGGMDVLTSKNGAEKFLSTVGPADLVGEIGVIFNIPQPFTVRSKRLSQVVRISHRHFMQIVQPYNADGKRVLSNFMQFLKELSTDLIEEVAFVPELLKQMNEEGISEELQNLEASMSNDQETAAQEPLTAAYSSYSCDLDKRVTIHGHHPDETSKIGRHAAGKLIFLPDSMEELLKLAEV
ncbi:potassium channel KAT4-like isoform X2 [Musa acuminata AAA Group]|uniref:potassium channel KAT4-like isoform X2 n=1 Tax=Musa acuminata AAA Group TaxID=214697 RepID=UPI0031DD9FA8